MAQITSYLQDISKAISQLQIYFDGNVLITGASGLIGGCLTDILMRHSLCHVYALGRDSNQAAQRFADYKNNSRFHFIEHDISKPLVSDINFDYIIHAASNASPNFFQKSPVEVMKSNLNGLCNLVEYGLNHHLKRMVYVSSGEIYGEGDGSIFSEEDCGYINILSPRSCYPSSKRATETLCVAYSQEYNAQIVIARPCHTYGPFFKDSDNRVYAQFIRNILKKEDIVMKSKGDQYRSWIYVIDCAAAILLLLEKGISGEAYNVANSDSNITIRELAEKIANIGHRKIVMDIQDDGNTTPIKKAVFSTEKLNNLGWKPLFSIDEGLKHTLEVLQC